MLGLATTFQVPATRCSVRFWYSPVPLVVKPTAQTSVADALTSTRTLSPPLGAFGLVWMVQAVPSQCSINVRRGLPVPANARYRPTAQTSLEARMKTLLRMLPPAPALGL